MITLLVMDSYNSRNMKRMLPNDTENKIHLLLDWSDNPRDIADPWYTGDFDVTYNDVLEGCTALLKEIKKEPLKLFFIPNTSKILYIKHKKYNLFVTKSHE